MLKSSKFRRAGCWNRRGTGEVVEITIIVDINILNFEIKARSESRVVSEAA